jgi:hypothetical protein
MDMGVLRGEAIWPKRTSTRKLPPMAQFYFALGHESERPNRGAALGQGRPKDIALIFHDYLSDRNKIARLS